MPVVLWSGKQAHKTVLIRATCGHWSGKNRVVVSARETVAKALWFLAVARPMQVGVEASKT